MKTVPLSEAKDRLSGLVDEAESMHESLHETLFWLSQPGIRDDLAAAEADEAAGNTINSDQLRAELGIADR